MLEGILLVAFTIELIITLSIIFHIAMEADTKYKNSNNFVLSALGYFIKGLFVNKNWFGVMLGVIVFILSIPAILLLLFVEAILWLCLFCVLWDFGNKQ